MLNKLTVSVAISTRNRGSSIAPTIESIVAADSQYEELVIVDQSTNDETEIAVKQFLHDPRVCYLRSDTLGLGVGRNVALQATKSDILVITDDDVTVSPDWIDAHALAFREYPHVAVTYGTVLAAEHDSSAGYLPSYVLDSDRHVRTFKDKCLARGIGANTAVRREAVLSFGGYDPAFGAGAKFKSCEDGDLTSRALMKGYEVYECKNSSVLHFGFRDWEFGRKQTQEYWFGIGAMCAKPIRCGRFDALCFVYEEAVKRAIGPFLSALMRDRRPLGYWRVSGFIKGFMVGLATPLDRSTLHVR